MSNDFPKLNVLVAYPYVKQHIDQLKKNKSNVRFLLDSGAFTAWKSGTIISLDDYCRLIDDLPVTPWRYFSLDVIGDPHGTMKNYETMLARGFNPIPIFTRGEDVSVLDDYYKNSDVVGIGGLVGTPGNKGFVKGIMRHVGDRKVHWLGFTSFDFVKFYKPYMCDSSGWESGARYGVANIYIGGGRFIRIQAKDFFDKKIKPDVVDAIRTLGFDVDKFLEKKNWHGGMSLSRQISAASIVKYTVELEKNLNVKQFSAVAMGKDALIHLVTNYKRLFKK